MRSVATFIAATARRMCAKPRVERAKSPISAPTAQPLQFIPDALQALLVENKPAMNTFFTKSQLPGAAFSNSISDAIDVIFGNADVQRAASQARMKLIRLTDFASFRSEIAAAINAAVGPETNVANLSPEAVVAALTRRADELDEAFEAAREDHAAHDRAHARRMERMQPLITAVGDFSVRAVTERDSLLMHIAGSSRDVGGPGGLAKQRFDALVAGGMSLAQINELGYPLDDRAKKAEEMRARLAIVMGILAQCKSFADDPYRGVQHLAGLGLDAEIAAHEAACAVVA